MDFSAEIKFVSTGELVLTGSSDGKSRPRYDFAPDVDLEIEIGLLDLMEEAYETGLYGTGSPGEVRDMLHSMQAVVEAHSPLYKLVIPRGTQRQMDKELAAVTELLEEGIIL